jgi:hypothetical protein
MDHWKGLDVDAGLRRRMVFFNLDAWWYPLNWHDLVLRPLWDLAPQYKALPLDQWRVFRSELDQARLALHNGSAQLPDWAQSDAWVMMYRAAVDLLVKRADALYLWSRGWASSVEWWGVMQSIFGRIDDSMVDHCFSMVSGGFWDYHEAWTRALVRLLPSNDTHRGGLEQWLFLARQILDSHGMYDVVVRIGDVWGSRARVVYSALPSLEISLSPPPTYYAAIGVLYHELAHLQRYRAWVASGIGLLALGTAWSAWDEEWVALWLSHHGVYDFVSRDSWLRSNEDWLLGSLFAGDYAVDIGPYSMYWVHAESQRSPPEEIVGQLYTLSQWRCSIETARTYVLRAYAGMHALDTIQQVTGIRMDYYRGYVRVRDFYARQGSVDALLHYGKVSVDDAFITINSLGVK